MEPPVDDTSDPPQSDEPIGLEDVARRLGVHYMTAYRYVRTGLLQARQDGGRWWVEPSDLDQFVADRSRPRPRRKRAALPAGIVERLADRLQGGDEEGAWRILDDMRMRADDPIGLVIRTLSGAMHTIGDRWEAGTTSVGEEHRASVVAMRLLGRMGAAGRRRGRTRGAVVVAAAPGDQHGLPTALASEVLRQGGFTVVDLGADLPADQAWRAAASADRLVCVGFCATTSLDERSEAELAEAIDHVRSEVGCPVVVGGAAVAAPVAERLGADHRTSTLPELLAVVEDLASSRPPSGEERR